MSSAKKLRELLATPVTEIPYLEDDQGVKVQIEELSQKQAQA